ncbi:MAG: hypothetical protein LBU23_09775, partial [Planctomycetota bacterium]|nr:hypothetical protein [Planctomycetota bacterium]
MRFLLLLCLILAALAPSPRAAGLEQPEDMEAEEATYSVKLAEMFRRHCVRVSLWVKSDAGELPEANGMAEDVRNERPTRLGGYWWDEKRIIVEDPIISDQFVREIEIGLPGSDIRWPARVAGRFVNLPALLLEVLPDASGRLPAAFPL